MHRQKLRGEADGNIFRAITDDGKTAKPIEAIIPVLAQDIDDHQFRFIGTGFFIGQGGLMITAKHVLDEVRPRGTVIGPIGVCHMTEDGRYFMRNIKQSFEYPNSDVLWLFLISHGTR